MLTTIFIPQSEAENSDYNPTYCCFHHEKCNSCYRNTAYQQNLSKLSPRRCDRRSMSSVTFPQLSHVQSDI